MKKRITEIAGMDPKCMDGDSLDTAKRNIHEILKPYLPYKAKNGITFNSNGISITTKEGLIFGDNYGEMNGTYAFMLKYSPTFSQESKYTTSCKINAFNETALEAISKEVKKSLTLYAGNLVNQFS